MFHKVSNHHVMLRSCVRTTYRSVFRYFSSENKSDLVVVTKQKKLHLIGINRPEKRNCVNTETAKQLRQAFENFENDDDAYAAVLYGKGGNFCAGFDLQQVAEGKAGDMASGCGPMGPTAMFLSKPVVAAVNGYAVAGGFELALWCDLRVMEDNAIMGVFCRRFGVPMLDGGTVRLPLLIGLSRALDLILTGRAVDAKEAFAMGLANKIAPCGTGIGIAVSLATSLCKFPQKCLRADRHSAYHSLFKAESLKEALQFEFENGKHVLSEESVTGAQTFIKGIGRHGSFHLDADLKKRTDDANN